MTSSLARSYAYCERLARRQAANFYHAFRLLPRPQRQAMCALYAFLRISDDLADAATPLPSKRQALDRWRTRWQLAREGIFSHRLHAALHHTMKTYAIPPHYLDEALTGVAMDLDIARYDTFEDLYHYCYRVASVVGLSCLHIWGFREPGTALPLAEAAGIAFQLTNILRDLGEDTQRQRIYLPSEDLKRFAYHEADLQRGIRDERLRALLTFEAERARHYFQRAENLLPLLEPAGRAVFQVMLRTYRALLEAIVASGFDVFARRIRVSRWRKLWLVIQAIPVRCGLR